MMRSSGEGYTRLRETPAARSRPRESPERKCRCVGVVPTKTTDTHGTLLELYTG